VPNRGWVSKNFDFFRLVKKSLPQTSYAKNLCLSATVIHVHDSVLVVKFVYYSYSPIDINKVGCMEV